MAMLGWVLTAVTACWTVFLLMVGHAAIIGRNFDAAGRYVRLMTHVADTLPQPACRPRPGESLPARWYTDPSITERETTHVFRKSWNYIGPLSQLSAIGDYVTGYAGGVPVVVLRNEQGLAGFVNVCRHRRHEVMKGRGNAKSMQCGYHAWTYDLAGGLKRVPRSACQSRTSTSPTFRCCRSAPKRSAPFVFVNLDAEGTGGEVMLQPGPRPDCRERRRARHARAATAARNGARTPTGRRCSRTISNAITAPSPIPASTPRSTCAPDVYTLKTHGYFSEPERPRCVRRPSRARARSSCTMSPAR